MSRDILFAAMNCLKSSDVIEALFFELGAGTFKLSSSNATIDLLPRLGLLQFVDLPSFSDSSSSSSFDVVLNGNCIKLQVHRTKMVMISVLEFLTEPSFKRSKNSMMSAHMARLNKEELGERVLCHALYCWQEPAPHQHGGLLYEVCPSLS